MRRRSADSSGTSGSVLSGAKNRSDGPKCDMVVSHFSSSHEFAFPVRGADVPIRISKGLRDKLPDHERKSAEQVLWDKSHGVCFLCSDKMVESSDDIVADHDNPDGEGGDTTLANLNLVHQECNSFKRQHSTVDVRPYLRLTRKIKRKGGFVKYDQAASLLEISFTPIDVIDDGAVLRVGTQEGMGTFPVFQENNKEGLFRFSYVELPRSALYNDDQCQPRNIKPNHVWQIYNDINRNPLHEAPACRLEKVPGSQQTYRALLFDGQHKALSFWIDGREKIVAKIYLDITKDQAVRLVNSIQSKIKKLPLSPFELAAKMSEEWQERWNSYEAAKGPDKASEDGFLKWVDTDERSRAKSAFLEALLETFIDEEQLSFTQVVLKTGQKKQSDKLTESAFRSKVLKPLLHTAPLKELIPAQQKLRQREHDVVVKLLNLIYDRAFKLDASSSENAKARAKRLVFQAAIAYVMSMLRNLVGHFSAVAAPRQLIERDLTPEQWQQVEKGIDLLLNHPVWTAPFTMSKKMTAVSDALSKNQDAATAFGDVGLKLGYIVGADKLPPDVLKD